MRRLALVVLVATITAACEGTPLPGDDDPDDAAATIEPLATSLEAGEAGVALDQLVSELAMVPEVRGELLRALESPDIELDDESVDAAFRNVAANQFETGWLAFLLTLTAEHESSAAAAAASASLRSLAISVFHEALLVSEVQTGLADGTITLNQARSALSTAFAPLRAAGEDDDVVLLPEEVPAPTLSLSRRATSPALLAERTAAFTTTAAAADQVTTASIAAGQDVPANRLEIAALLRLALLTGRSSDPPSSAFGRYVLSVGAPEQLVYSLAGRQTIGVAVGAAVPVVSFDVADDGSLGVTVLDVETEQGDLEVRSSSRSTIGDEEVSQPAFGRPEASIQSGFGVYQMVVSVPFVNPANAPFRVTCMVPSLGGRVTMTLASRRAQGDLRASGRLNLAPAQIAELEQDSQLVCAGSYGTVETGRIGIPPELLPELEDEG
ncbi:MAG TPA: hypothetical protein VFZ12_02350 [Dehalococcoidia bacterium]|nr:hypothetical protein [Dehalococcoidia bacterium]